MPRNLFPSKKGYVSFILFFILSLVVLAPLTLQFQTPPSPSIALALAAQESLNNHLAFSRSLLPAAQDAYDDTKLVLAAPAPSPLTEDEKEQIVRAAILQKWSELEFVWNENSNANVKISCSPPAEFQSQSIPAPQSLPPNLSDLWQSCAKNIQFSYLQASPKITISGVLASSSYQSTNASAQTEIYPMELD